MAQPPPDSKNPPQFIEQIYQQINDLFGQSSNALFQMEVPGRVLEKGTYDYEGSDGKDAMQRKPETVVDAEFRLSDDVYSLSHLVSVPKGPKDAVCSWLLAEVDNWEPPVDDVLADLPTEFGGSGEVEKGVIPPKRDIPSSEADRPKKLPRVDLYQKLLDAYEAERFRWAAFKRNAHPGFSDPGKVDEYNKMLAFYAPVVDKKLEAMFTLLLVRGQYHRVRRYVGYVDIESASEILLAAKENLRSSVFRSIDDSQDVWPVYFTPANWAKYLSTDFHPQDLLSSEETVLEEIFEKEKERALLLSRRNNIKAAEQDIPALEAAEDTARRAFSDAQDKIYAQWADSAVQVVKLYFKAKGNNSASKDPKKSGLGSAGELNSALTKNGQSPISDQDFDELKENFKKGVEAESRLQLASESLSRAQLAAASARGKDKTLVLSQLDEQIQSLSLDIEYLRQTLDTSANATRVPIKSTDDEGKDTMDNIEPETRGKVPPSIALPSQEQGASLWEDVVIKLKASSTFDSTFESASVSRMDWSVNLFFGSASGSESSSDSDSSAYHTAMNTSIDIGFRAMKVEIGRPWFNSGILQRSNEYYHLVGSGTKIAPAPGPLRKALDNINGDRNNTTIIANANRCLLPSWPTAFIVVKDVHIIMKSDTAFSTNEVSDMKRAMNAGGGILCFRVSKSSSSSQHRTKSAMTHDEKSVSIKIPGPQIIGWLSEFAPEDNTQPAYKSIGTKELEFLKVSSGKP
ncbi:unnamed protein product [Tuber aestivum]|uniref:Uncharacterized protein n=1 Tax=Tuber aestivum TaxID=59557 RepID=A0A292PUF9_9PEZI|nr:unnamed protein product [Tuber aestivum]